MKLQNYLCVIAIVTPQFVFAQENTIDSLKKQISIAQKSGDFYAEGSNLQYLAELQADNGSTFEALKNAQQAIAIFEKLGKKSDIFNTYIAISTVHQQLHNGDKILEYAIPGLKYAKESKDTSLWINMLTAIGIGYDEKNDYEKAANYYLECANMEKYLGLSTAISYMNVSSSFSQLRKPEEGRRYAELAVQQSIKDGDERVEYYSYSNLALANILDKKLDEAQKALFLAEKLNKSEAINDQRDIFLLNSMFFAAKGNFKDAYFMYNSFYKIDSTMSSQQRNAQFGELETIYETKRKEHENLILNEKIFMQRLWIFVALFLLLLLGIVIWLQRNRLIIKDKLLNVEKELLAKEKQRADEEKAFQEKELTSFTQSLREKSAIIENLRNDIEKRTATDNSTPPNHSKETGVDDFLHQLTLETILTEEQWRSFRLKFERVHYGFFQKFSKFVPDATESELRLAALTKLNMTNNEIASMLGISPESVTKTRYRLRKKIGKEEGLESILNEI